MFKVSSSSHHSALDQRSWESKINWRAYDIAIDCGANRFPRLRYAWCDDCVYSENASHDACALPKKSKCRRATCSKRQPILTREAYCFCDHFRATGAYEAVQVISDVFNVRLQKDDVQDFQTERDQTLLSASESPTKRQSSCPAPNAKAQTDGKTPSNSFGSRGESPSETWGRIMCRYRRKCTNPSCNFWHPSLCLNYKSESGCKYNDKCHFRHVGADEKPSTKSKKSCAKGSVAFFKKESIQLSVCLKTLIGENLFYGKKGPSRGIIQKCVPQWAKSLRTQVGGEVTRRHLAPRKMRLQSSMGLGETCLQIQKIRIKHCFSILLKTGQQRRPFQNLGKDFKLFGESRPCEVRPSKWEASISSIRKMDNTKKPSTNARIKLEVPMDAAMLCKKGTYSPSRFQETAAKSDASNKILKTKYVCIVEAPESTRQRLESSLPKKSRRSHRRQRVQFDDPL